MSSDYSRGDVYQILRRSDGKLVAVTAHRPDGDLEFPVEPPAYRYEEEKRVVPAPDIRIRLTPGVHASPVNDDSPLGVRRTQMHVWMVEDSAVEELLRTGCVASIGGQVSEAQYGL